jgi:hypothetical protein
MNVEVLSSSNKTIEIVRQSNISLVSQGVPLGGITQIVQGGTATGVTFLNGLQETILLTGSSGILVSIDGQTIIITQTGDSNLSISGVLQNQLNALNNNTGNYYLITNPSGFLNSLSGLSVSYVTGISGNLQFSINSTNTNLQSTGSNLDNKINSLSGYSNNQFSTIVNLTNTGVNLQNQLNNLTNQTGNYYLNSNPYQYIRSGDVSSIYSTISNLQTTGANLQSQINTINNNTGLFYLNSNPQGYATSGNLQSTGQTLIGEINFLKNETGKYYLTNNSGYLNSLSGLSTGYVQGISGVLNSSINNVSGTLQTQINGINLGNYYLNSNPSGFLNTLSGLSTGYVINISGLLSNRIELTGQTLLGLISSSAAGIATLNSLSGTVNITGIGFISVFTSGQYIYISGNTGNFASISNLQLTGSNLQSQINSINNGTGNFVSSSQTGQFYPVSNPQQYVNSGNLHATGSNLDSKINSLSGYSNNNFYLNSNPSGYLTGFNSGIYVTAAQTGQFYPASNPQSYATSGNLINSGTALNDKINVLSGNSVLLFGNQNINGTKTFNTGVNVSGNGIDFYNQSNPTWREGRVFYDNGEKTLAYYNDHNGITVNLGQELLVRAVNKSNNTIFNGTPVYISGAQGNRPVIYPAIARDLSSDRSIGVATHDIPNNNNGYITTKGIVHDLNLSQFNEGDTLYLSSTVTGGFTNVIPNRPNHLIKIGIVLNNSATAGHLLVDSSHVDSNLEYLHDVFIPNPQNNDLLSYNQASGFWVNQPNFSGVLQSGINSINNNTGNYYLNSNPYQYVTSGNLFQTGSVLNTKINTLSGYVDSNLFNLTVTGSNRIFSGNLSGIGGAQVILNGNNILISGGAGGGGGGHTINNYFINSGSGLFLFRKNLTNGLDKQFILYPLQIDYVPLVVAGVRNDVSDILISCQISGANNTGFWAVFSNTLANTGYYLDILASNPFVTGVGISNIIVSGVGEINTASNLGNGFGVFNQKNALDLQFNSISGGTGISLENKNNTILINYLPKKFQITVDFGFTGSGQGDIASYTFSGSSGNWVTNNSNIVCYPMGKTTINHDPDDVIVDNISAYVSNIYPGTGFDVTAYAPNGTFGSYVIGVNCFE